jgi:hypothetical protein
VCFKVAMPCHLISDGHEWINEIPTDPIYYLAKPQPRAQAWQNQRGKKILLNELVWLSLTRAVRADEALRADVMAR